MYNEEIMKKCFKHALSMSTMGVGGPFGATITRNGEHVVTCANSVLDSVDCTCHAEMNAIRFACKLLSTYDLSDCEIYTTGYPCPMCLGAIMWANIKKVYVSGTLEDAEKVGFKDKFIYETIDKLKNMCYNNNELVMEFHNKELAKELYNTYALNNGIIY